MSLKQVRTVVVCRPALEQDAQHGRQGYITIWQNPDTNNHSLLIPINDGSDRDTVITPTCIFGNDAQPLDDLVATEIEPLLQAMCAGESSAVIAYGQTGSGKSYIIGTENSANTTAYDAKSYIIGTENNNNSANTTTAYANSVIAFVSRRLFDIAVKEKKAQDLKVMCSMVEIYKEARYKEQVYDLLHGPSRPKISSTLDYKSSKQRVDGPDDLHAMIHEGSNLRNTDSTGSNLRSSRSHAVISITVEYKQQSSTTGRLQVVKGELLIADLAGSEKATDAAVGSVSSKQGAGINSGLLFLGIVIDDVSKTGKSLSFNNSELTKLLKPALSGSHGGSGSNTLILGCISPCLAHIERTKNTLQFLEKAGMISNKVKRDVESLDSKVQDALRAQNAQLKEQLDSLASQLLLVQQSSLQQQQQATDNDTNSNNNNVVVLSREEHDALLQNLQRAQDESRSLQVLLENTLKKNDDLEQHVDSLEQQLVVLFDKATIITTPDQQQHEQQENEQTPGAAVQNGNNNSELLLMLPRPSPRTPRLSTSASITAAAVLSPVLAAVRETEADVLASARGSCTSIPLMTAADVCLAEESHLQPDQLDVLMALITKKLEDSSTANENAADGVIMSTPRRLAQMPETTSKDELINMLQSRNLEITALQMALRSYNNYLGQTEAELIMTREQLEEVGAQLQQAAEEKIKYMKMSAGFQEALEVSQYQLDQEVARHSHTSTTPPSSGGRFNALSSSIQHKFSRLSHHHSPNSPPPISSSSNTKSPISSSPLGTNSGSGLGALIKNALGSPSSSAQQKQKQKDKVQPNTEYSENELDFEYNNTHHDDGVDPIYSLEEEDVGGLSEPELEVPIDVTTPLSAFPLPAQDLASDDEDANDDDNIAEEVPADVPTMVQPPPMKELMQGPIKTDAIAGDRKEQMSSDFVQKNQHWKPLAAGTSRQQSAAEPVVGFGKSTSIRSKRK